MLMFTQVHREFTNMYVHCTSWLHNGQVEYCIRWELLAVMMVRKMLDMGSLSHIRTSLKGFITSFSKLHTTSYQSNECTFLACLTLWIYNLKSDFSLNFSFSISRVIHIGCWIYSVILVVCEMLFLSDWVALQLQKIWMHILACLRL